MKLRWATRDDPDTEAIETRIAQARSHLRIVLNELNTTVSRIEDKVQRGLPSD